MAINKEYTDMLKESLPEMIEGARLCILYKKPDKGCLGYPAATLLLAVIDSIGSYHRGNAEMRVQIEGKEYQIKKDGLEHFYILNSRYFGWAASMRDIRTVYENYRSPLVHNTVIAPEHLLTMHSPFGPFTRGYFQRDDGKEYPAMHLVPLFRSCSAAVEAFLKDIDSIVPQSRQIEIIKRKR